MAHPPRVSSLVALGALLVGLAIWPAPGPAVAAARGAGADTGVRVERRGAPIAAGLGGGQGASGAAREGGFPGLVAVRAGRGMDLEGRGSGGARGGVAVG